MVPAGPKVIRFVPPLIISSEEVDNCFVEVELAIAKLTAIRKTL